MNQRHGRGLRTAMLLLVAQVAALVAMISVSALLADERLAIPAAVASSVDAPADDAQAAPTTDPFRLILF